MMKKNGKFVQKLILIAQKKGFDALITTQKTRINLDGPFWKK